MKESKENKVTFPPLAQERLRMFQAQLENLQAQMQQFADGVLLGMGVDLANNDASVSLDDMSATVTPKETT